MSTLQEIEAAVEKLPRPDQEALLTFLTECVRRASSMGAEDPFDAIVGAFAGPVETTGRNSEEILYRKDD